MEIVLDQSNKLFLDEKKWFVSSDRTCELLEEHEKHFYIKNKNGLKVKLPKKIFEANNLAFSENTVELPEGLYEHFIRSEAKRVDEEKFNAVFKQRVSDLFTNSILVLKEPEYFLLRPHLLESTGVYLGAYNISVGSLLKAWETDTDFYFDSIQDKEDLFLMAVRGSVLTNRYTSIFWCRSNRSVISYSSNVFALPNGFHFYLSKFKALIRPEINYTLDFQYVALMDLLSTIDGKVE